MLPQGTALLGALTALLALLSGSTPWGLISGILMYLMYFPL